MTEHVTEWLGPYHDGELHGARLQQTEQHLAECAECRAELEAIRSLSALLHESPPPADFLPAGHFTANLKLSLPRQPERIPYRRMLEIGWWLVPVGLLAAWLFVQITFSLSTMVTAASNSGLLGSSLAWLQGQPVQTEWFSDAMSLFGNQINSSGSSFLLTLNDVDVLATQWADRSFWEVLFALAYLGWLASWWLRRPEQSVEPASNPSQSQSV